MRTLTGIGVSPGIAIAPAYKVERGEITVEENSVPAEHVEEEIKRFEKALRKSKDQLIQIQASVAKTMGEDSAAIIEAQIMLLSDVSVIDETKEVIRKKFFSAETAFDKVINKGIEVLDGQKDQVMADRAHDLRDLRRRVLSNLMELSHHVIVDVREDRILVVQHLAPSETAHLFHNQFVGIALEMGGTTSHVAIMTRTMEIPCVIGLDGVTAHIDSHDTVIIDGSNGKVIVNPTDEVLDDYREKQKAQQRRREWISKYVDEKGITTDGHRVSVGSNIELPGEVESVLRYNSDGVGLFRTELLYTRSDRLPGEDEQTRVYRSLTDKIDPKPLIIRTFDIGGDKFSELLGTPFEPNPFLGWRAIRIGLSRPRILKTQIRAILRASHKRNIKMMFPMISNIDEVYQALKLVEESKDELRREGLEFQENLEVGVMVEVPSTALLSKEIAEHVDFFSIGTNDLVQYTLAVDRGNQRISHLYQSFNPAVLDLIDMTIVSAHRAGIWCGLCGEIAADARATILLVGLGIDELSVNPPSVPKIKGIIHSISRKDARKIAGECLRFSTHREVVEHLDKKARELLPDEFFEGFSTIV